jgi:hypothetical protein
MTSADRFTIVGVYVSQPVLDALEGSLHETAGIVDLEGYFDPAAGSIPVDDPGAEATDALLADVVAAFATLYDEAAFDAAERIDHHGFELVHLAATPARVANARELFQAAATIQDTDLRTVQTAILAASLDVDLERAER